MKRRTRIKICGVTRPEDALEAARLGADAIGMVFHGASPRAVTLGHAADIATVLPAFVAKVALFVDAPAARVREVVQAIHPDLLQFHGQESAAFCAQFATPYLKAVRLGEPDNPVDLLEFATKHAAAKALLLDAFVPGEAGGGGRRFDWALVPRDMGPRIVLAGGLTPGNVADAVRRIRPWAVDVSSGVEGSHKGIKDHTRLAAFIEAVKHADE